MKAIAQARQRYRHLLELLHEEASTAAELAARLRPTVTTRQVQKDLCLLREWFPTQLIEEPGMDARRHCWRLVGLPPQPLTETLDYLTHDELTALIAARGMLRQPDTRNPGWERPASGYVGDLSAALHGLLERCGMADEVATVAPRSLGVSRFAIAPEPAGALALIERALRTRQAVAFAYRNRKGEERPLHVMPMRLVAIRGEWHLFAWSPDSTTATRGRIKQYRLSRITSTAPPVTIPRQPPPGCPGTLPHDDVDRMLASGFNATSSADLSERKRLVIGIGPEVVPDIADRVWGDHQTFIPAPDLGPGWHRLTFTTTGWLEARGWLLSLGRHARVEQPEVVRDWIRAEVAAMGQL